MADRLKMSVHKKNKDKLNIAIYRDLCNFISDKFLRRFLDENGQEISQNQYADKCGLSSSTISKIKETTGYDIPISTISSICLHEKFPLGKLFQEFEKTYKITMDK